MDDQSKEEKLTETRRSFQQVSFWRKFYGIVCPCFSYQKEIVHDHDDFHQHEETKSSMKEERNVTACFDRIDMKKNSIETDSTIHRIQRRKTSLYVSNLNRKRVINIQQNRDYLIKSTIQKWHSYPIYHYYKEKEIVALGFKNRKLLAYVQSRRPLPSKTAENKTKRTASFMDDYIHDENNASNVDKFWGKRYYLFQKFDEGISLDEQSWGDVVPEAVAQYIASKVRCDTVLDAFCGVGGLSLKLANTSYRVIANDIDDQKIQCLKRNSSVYSVDNIETRKNDFHEITHLEPDIIVIHPSVKVMNWQNRNHTKPQDLFPDFQFTIQKAIKLSNNFVLLLPANIDPNLLASCIVQAYKKQKINVSTCSIKIEKIFFLSKMAYLAVYMGCQVQNQIKLNDELNYIYSLLKDKNDKGKVFKDKRVVKAIREKHGMINLLNFVFESQDLEEGSPIQKFYQFVRSNKLLDEKKLEKILEEEQKQRSATKKIPFFDPTDEEQEEQKYVDEESIERTVSYYSTNSPNRVSYVSANRISAEPRSFRSTTSANITDGCILRSRLSDNQSELKAKEASSDNEPKCNKQDNCIRELIEQEIQKPTVMRSAFQPKTKVEEEDKDDDSKEEK